MSTEASREARVRRHLRKHELLLQKSRVKNLGEYRIIDFNNRIIMGETFNVTLEEAETYVNEIDLDAQVEQVS